MGEALMPNLIKKNLLSLLALALLAFGGILYARHLRREIAQTENAAKSQTPDSAVNTNKVTKPAETGNVNFPNCDERGVPLIISATVKKNVALLSARLAEECSHRETVAAAIDFVHAHSYLPEDMENYNYKKYLNARIVQEELLAAAKGGEKPPLSCGPRTHASRWLLQEMGIKLRLVQFYTDRFAEVRGHRMLEAFNPETEKWELWDPSYDVYYENAITSQPIDAETLLAGKIDEFQPVGSGKTGWKEHDLEYLRDYFGAVLFEHEDFRIGMKNATIKINPLKFDLDKKFADNLTFAEWARKCYGQPKLELVK